MKQERHRLDNGLRSRLAAIDAAKICGKGVYAIRHGGANPAPVHRHQGWPGVAYIIEGEMTEYRIGADGRATTAVKKAGETALERTGVVHWWKNASGRIARALVVDIVPAK